jgi:hypothetical protein
VNSDINLRFAAAASGFDVARIAELQAERLRVEAELAALEETPDPSLHPATSERYIRTVNALLEVLDGSTEVAIRLMVQPESIRLDTGPTAKRAGPPRRAGLF